jgi:hypothetical protein
VQIRQGSVRFRLRRAVAWDNLSWEEDMRARSDVRHFAYNLKSGAPAPAGGGETRGWFFFYKWHAEGEGFLQVASPGSRTAALGASAGDRVWFVLDGAVIGRVVIASVESLVFGEGVEIRFWQRRAVPAILRAPSSFEHLDNAAFVEVEPEQFLVWESELQDFEALETASLLEDRVGLERHGDSLNSNSAESGEGSARPDGGSIAMNQLGDFLAKLNGGGYGSLAQCQRAIAMFAAWSEADKDRARRIAEAYFAPGASMTVRSGAPSPADRALEPGRTFVAFIEELERGAYPTLFSALRALTTFQGTDAERARAERMAEAYFGAERQSRVAEPSRPEPSRSSHGAARARPAALAAVRLDLSGFADRLERGAYVDLATAKRVIGRCKDWTDADREVAMRQAAAHFGVEPSVPASGGTTPRSPVEEFAEKLRAGAYEKVSGARRAVTMLAGLGAQEKAEARRLVEEHFGAQPDSARGSVRQPFETPGAQSARAPAASGEGAGEQGSGRTKRDEPGSVILSMKEVIGTVSEALSAIKGSRELVSSTEAVDGDVRVAVAVLGRAIRVLDHEIVTRFARKPDGEPANSADPAAEEKEAPAEVLAEEIAPGASNARHLNGHGGAAAAE